MQRVNNWVTFRRSTVIGLTVSAFLACSPAGNDSKVSSTGGGGSGTGGSAGPGPGKGSTAGTQGLDIGMIAPDPLDGPCMGLECAVPACAGGGDTTISGKVYAPDGKLPLYNVLVYVPNGEVPPLTEGVSCDRCGASVVDPVTSAVTDETGAFVLRGAPAGADIPIVIQVGKWRRQIKVPAVTGCMDNPLLDPNTTRLPKNKAEGNIPRIAIAAGGADAMECLPRRLGIEDAEFTTSAGDGRIHLFTATDNPPGDLSVKEFAPTLNGGAALPHSMELWSSVDNLKKYDIVILSCEGNRMLPEKPMAARQAMYDYASQGGRIFASHWQDGWFAEGPAPLPTTGTWTTRPNPIDAPGKLPATINQTFPKGEALAKWLVNVGASTTLGTLDITGPRDNIQEVSATASREWITVNNPNAMNSKSVQYMSFNTPIGVPEAQVCGRAVFTGLHVSNLLEDRPQPPGFPGLCENTELSPEEKAVAFMLFDLSACVMNDDRPPEPPK